MFTLPGEGSLFYWSTSGLLLCSRVTGFTRWAGGYKAPATIILMAGPWKELLKSFFFPFLEIAISRFNVFWLETQIWKPFHTYTSMHWKVIVPKGNMVKSNSKPSSRRHPRHYVWISPKKQCYAMLCLALPAVLRLGDVCFGARGLFAQVCCYMTISINSLAD